MEKQVDNKYSNDNKYEVKIGKMMKGLLEKLIQNNMLSEYELEHMQQERYSKLTFNLNLPVLKVVKDGEVADIVKRDSNGYNRYYDTVIYANKTQYLICSQWVEGLHKTNVESWIITKMCQIIKLSEDNYESDKEIEVSNILRIYWPYIDGSIRKRIELKFRKV